MDLIVAKFGGTSVGDGSRIRKAAQSVVNEYMKGNQLVVVVSAVNNATDELIELSNEAIGGGLTDKQKAEIMAMGELTSSRLFAAAIESLGVKAEFIDPYNDKWPVITDSNSLNAKIDFATTDKKCEGIKNLISQGIIPVICGFLGKGPSGEITTIGRGGSDVTAFLLGHCLSANNVVIVTDVDGVMSTDPNKIEEAELLDEISVEEMRDLATHGAQVLHPHALKYKDPLISAKIINFNNGDLSSEGTKITGPFEGDMLKTVSLYKNPISVIAIVGEEMLKKVGLLADLTSCLAENEINIFGISAGQNSITVFVEKKDSDKKKKKKSGPDTCPVQVDFDALARINPDVKAWIYIKGTGINYPIVQTTDNTSYLHRTFEGKDSFIGAIFLDAGCEPDFSSENSIVYGHNLKNGQMFGM